MTTVIRPFAKLVELGIKPGGISARIATTNATSQTMCRRRNIALLPDRRLGCVDSYRVKPAEMNFFAGQERLCRWSCPSTKQAQRIQQANSFRPAGMWCNRPVSASFVLEYAWHVHRPHSLKQTRLHQTGSHVLTVHTAWASVKTLEHGQLSAIGRTDDFAMTIKALRF